MSVLLKVVGWTLRACALICVTWIVVSVARGQITSVPQLLSSVVWHAGFAFSGVQALGCAKRMDARRGAEAAVGA